MDMLSIKEYQARSLLMSHQWSIEHLMFTYAEKGPEKLFKEAGLFIANEKNDLPSPHPPPSTITCDVGFDDIPPNKAMSKDCGHFFCTSCKLYTSYNIFLFNRFLCLLIYIQNIYSWFACKHIVLNLRNKTDSLVGYGGNELGVIFSIFQSNK